MPAYSKLTTDFSSLVARGADKHPAWRSFQEAMFGKAYGGEALDDAWVWFQVGWNCGYQDAVVKINSMKK